MKVKLYKGGVHLVCETEDELTLVREGLATRLSDYNDTGDERTTMENMILEMDNARDQGMFEYKND
jgi:hypothetical protein